MAAAASTRKEIKINVDARLLKDIKLLSAVSKNSVDYWFNEALRSLVAGSAVRQIVRAEKQRRYNLPRKAESARGSKKKV